MKEQFKPSVKELYSSLHAPESLKEKTLAAIGEGKTEKKAKILEINFKTLGALAACFLLCFGLLLSGIFEGGSVNISLDGKDIAAQTVIGRTSSVTYLPQAAPMSAKNADNARTATALKLDVEIDGKTTVCVEGATLALENGQGQLCAVSGETVIESSETIYVLVEDADEIKVIFTSKKEEKTLSITENSDGTYSVGIK